VRGDNKDFLKMRDRQFPKSLVITVRVLIVAVLLVSGVGAFKRFRATEYRVFAIPNGRFEIVVYRTPMAFAMPGQSSDAPGYFQLRERNSGKVLQQRSVDMVSMVDQVEWSETNVNVRIFADWALLK
jgi:hypothetical protein